MAANTQGVLENLTDGYLAESQQIKGGYFVTDSLADINDKSIVTGSMCYNTSNNRFYKYDGTTWVEIDIINTVVNDLPTQANANVLVTYATSKDSNDNVTGKYTTTLSATFAKSKNIYDVCSISAYNGIIGMAAAVGLKQVSSGSSSVTLTLQPEQAIAMHKYAQNQSSAATKIHIPDGWSCATLDGGASIDQNEISLRGDFTIIGRNPSYTSYKYIISSDSRSIQLTGQSSANLSLTVYKPSTWYYNIINIVGFNQLSVTIPSSVILSEKSITFDIYKHGNLVWCYKDFGTTLEFQDDWDLQLPEDWRPKTTSYGLRISDRIDGNSVDWGTTFEIPTSGKISTLGQADYQLRYISMVYSIN